MVKLGANRMTLTYRFLYNLMNIAYSSKVTTATSLYQKGVDKQLNAARSGHMSTAIRAYKRTSNKQLKAVSGSLYPPNLSKPKGNDYLSSELSVTSVSTVHKQ
jgi:hypothetical protein